MRAQELQPRTPAAPPGSLCCEGKGLAFTIPQVSASVKWAELSVWLWQDTHDSQHKAESEVSGKGGQCRVLTVPRGAIPAPAPS